MPTVKTLRWRIPAMESDPDIVHTVHVLQQRCRTAWWVTSGPRGDHDEIVVEGGRQQEEKEGRVRG
jgi:hypothetical protein